MSLELGNALFHEYALSDGLENSVKKFRADSTGDAPDDDASVITGL
jgi:hypothetical protein